jgi:hypothetical protein
MDPLQQISHDVLQWSVRPFLGLPERHSQKGARLPIASGVVASEARSSLESGYRLLSQSRELIVLGGLFTLVHAIE